MTALARMLARLDARFPKRGPCGICGGPDARHRLWDSIETTARLEGIQVALAEYDLSWLRPRARALAVQLLLDAYREARRTHRPLPGSYPL